jgi:hypothetical protein
MGRLLDIARGVGPAAAENRLRLMAEYTALVTRLNDGLAFLENEAVPQKKRDRWFPEWESLLQKVGPLAEQLIASLGRDLTAEEAVHGFPEAGQVPMSGDDQPKGKRR